MQNFIKEIKSLTILILAILFLKETVVELYIVPTSSMEKNILRGDMLVGSRYIYGMKVPQKIWVPFTAVSIPTFLPDYRFPAFKDVDRVIIGTDTRESSDLIESDIIYGFNKMKVECNTLGVVSTPMLSFTTKKFNYDLEELSNDELIEHFINYGYNEGRIYK